MTTEANSNNEQRIRDDKHFATLLRRRLESRSGNGALRQRLARMCDSELIETYLPNERLGREHAAKRLAEKGASE